MGKIKYLLAIGMLLLFMGIISCDLFDDGETPPTKEDGTLTVGLTAADAIEGKDVLGGLVNAGANPAIDPILAGVDFSVSSGSGSATMAIMAPPYDIWVGTGGSSYDVYLWVDMNGNRDTVQYPESGVDMQLSTFPFTVVIDGDVTVTYTGADLVTVP